MKTLLCTIAKCENKYLMEWIVWHLKLGFDKIVIYDNNDLDGEKVSDVVGELANVKTIDWRGREQKSCEVQVAAYNDCYRRHTDYEWLLFSDIDEFLEFKDFKTVKEYLSQSWVRHANAIKVHWKCYSDNGHLYSQDGLVTETYTQTCTNGSVNNYTKSFYRGGLKDFKIRNVHYCSQIGGVYYQNGVHTHYSSSTTDNNVNHECCWLRHYVTKSLEEYIRVKYARRGKGSSKTRLNKDFYFKYNKKTSEKERLFEAIMSEYNVDNQEETNNIKKQRAMPNIVDVEPAWCRMTPKVKSQEHNKEIEKNPEIKTHKQKTTRQMPNAVDIEPAWCRATPKAKTSYDAAKPNIADVIDKIDFNKKLDCKNRLHILIVNLNQLNFTQHLINDLLVQDEKFDLTVFDQGSTENGTKRYLADLKEKWPLEDCCLNVIENSVNAPLNHVWNWFNKYTDNEFLAYFNNDIVVCDNIVSDAIKIFDKEEDVAIISHPTNKKEFAKSNELEYELEHNVYQGWDFIIRKNEYKEIPNELWIYSGDNYLFQEISKQKKYVAWDISSPIIHYRSKTISANKNQIDQILKNDRQIWKNKYDKTNLKFLNLKYSYSDFKGEFPIDKTKKVIVSFTSWEKRIHNVPITLSYMMKQTKLPDKIILNLSEEEFKGKEHMLDDVKKLERENPIFELNMVSGPDTKVWKKIIPTLERYRNDIVISIDDDIIYPSDFIEQFLLKYNEMPYTPITGIHKVWYGLHHCCGAFNLMQWKFLSIYINDWKDIWMKCNSSDTFYNFIVNLNGYSYTHSNVNYFDNIKVFNEIDGWTKKCMKKENFTVVTYKTLIDKYGTIKNLNIKVK